MNPTPSLSSSGQERLHHIDLLETLALFFMLCYHSALYSNVLMPNSGALDYVNYFSRTILSTCVPLFFFANGYLLFRKPLDLKKHAKKTLRLAGLGVFWILFLLLVMQPFNQQYFTRDALLQEFWTLKDGWNNHLWFLGVLVCLYIFYPLLKSTYDSNRKAFVYFLIVSFLLTFGNALINLFITVFNRVVRHVEDPRLNFNYFHIFNPYSGKKGFAVVYFCLGAIVSDLRPRIEAIPLRRRNLLAAAGLVLSCTLLFLQGVGYTAVAVITYDVVWWGYDSVFTLCNVLCLYVLSLNCRREIPLLRLISSNTLGIYLIHDIIKRLTGGPFAAVPVLQNFLGTGLYACILMLLCLVVCLIVKKIPLLRKLM